MNYYGPDARIGLHQDSDEKDFAAPVVSLSLGDTGLSRVGGLNRSGPTWRCGLPRAMPWCSAVRRASPSTASTAFFPATSTLLPRRRADQSDAAPGDEAHMNYRTFSFANDLVRKPVPTFRDHSLGVIHPIVLPALSLMIAMRPTPGTSQGSRTTCPPSLVARASAVERSFTATSANQPLPVS